MSKASGPVSPDLVEPWENRDSELKRCKRARAKRGKPRKRRGKRESFGCL